MFAELLTVERNELTRDLVETYQFKPYIWALGRENAAENYILSQINEAVKTGGIARAYYLGGKVQGLCVIRPDTFATHELHLLTFQITHLLAMGKPDVQLSIKSLLLRETIRGLPKNICIIARCPYSDLTSFHALKSCGFFTTHTALILAKDLSNNDWFITPAEDYEVTPLKPEHLDSFDGLTFDVPKGVLGWDVNLPPNILSKIHRNWLRTYASTAKTPTAYSSDTQTLLAAKDGGRVVGIAAERTESTARDLLGFNVGVIDILATAPEYQSPGNGVRSKLIKESLNQFAQNRVQVAELVLHSRDSFQSQFYQQMGFFTVGTNLTLIKLKE